MIPACILLALDILLDGLLWQASMTISLVAEEVYI